MNQIIKSRGSTLDGVRIDKIPYRNGSGNTRYRTLIDGFPAKKAGVAAQGKKRASKAARATAKQALRKYH